MAAPAVQQLAAWQALGEPRCAALLDSLVGIDATPAPALIERLRRQWDAAEVNAAIELMLARTRARAKFGAAAEQLWADRRGVEMASGPRVAQWKAERFARAAGVGGAVGGASSADGMPIADLCCGIGGDLMALARVARAVGIDSDPVRAWMAARNSGAATRCADAVATPVDAPLAHADPARREAGGARLIGVRDLLPPLAAIRAATARCAGTGIKLGPGMDLSAEDHAPGDEIEFISEGRMLVQQMLWSGCLAQAPGERTASRACTGATVTGRADEPEPTAHPGAFGRYLLVPDPALERARLMHLVAAPHSLAEPAPGLGVLTTDALPPAAGACAAWFDAYEIVAELPTRERAAAAWLAERGAGIVTVRTRGGACDPDAWQHSLRGRGDQPWTVFVLRVGDARRVLAVRAALSA